MKDLEKAMSIINGSKQFEFECNEEGCKSVLCITSYRNGETLKLDLSQLTPDMLEALQVEDKEYTHSIVISEQVDIKNAEGTYCGTEELKTPLNAEDCRRPKHESFHKWLCALYPQYEWIFDDGTDWDEDANTDFCQYVAKIDDNDPTHIYLASYYRTEL